MTASVKPAKTAGSSLDWRQRLSRWDYKTAPYLYIAPFFILFAVVGLFPLLYTGWISLHDWHLIRGDQGFIGGGNFIEVLGQPRFYVALRNTFSIFLLSSIPQVIFALLIAAGLTRTCGPRPSGEWACCCPTWWHRSRFR